VSIQPPSASPCTFCPYRQDVPSGVWAENEYAKLPLYDVPTYEQPLGLFLCHLRDKNDVRAQVCGGWAGCHDGDDLMAVRIALASRQITMETARAICNFVSPVPLFASGAEAAAHGMGEIEDPSPEARRAIDKIASIRTDLT
jgi:hypothetical protein